MRPTLDKSVRDPPWSGSGASTAEWDEPRRAITKICGLWEFETPTALESVLIDSHLRTNHLLAVRDAVVAGVGVAWLPSWLIKPNVLARRVKPVLAGMRLAPLDVHTLFLTQARGATAMRAVLGHLAAELPASLEK